MRDVRQENEAQQCLLFNQEIIELIIHSRILISPGASAKDREIGGVQMIIKSGREEAL